MTYKEARQYIEERGKLGSVLGLLSMKRLLAIMGNPHDDLKFVHVAGTNGKGSTIAFLSSVLEAAGYRTGCFHSPAVFEYREQIRVNGSFISEEEAARGIAVIKEAVTAMEAAGEGSPTSFEVETALAFWYFKQQGCDMVLLETGLGGDLDATNVVSTTVCSVITALSYDHMKILGNTLEEIAEHKAGIIKPMVPTVLYTFEETEDKKKAWDVVRRISREKKTCLYTTEPYEVQLGAIKEGVQTFHYRDFWNLQIGMAGRYQVYNACLAVETAMELIRQGFNIGEREIIEGLSKAYWPGRFEIISKNPFIVMDGAHNPGGALKLRESLDLYFTNKRILYIMGVLGDKDYREVIRVTHDAADLIYTVTPPNARALPAEELAGAVRAVHAPDKVIACESIEKALLLARQQVGKDDVILAFGSLSYLGDLKNIINKLG